MLSILNRSHRSHVGFVFTFVLFTCLTVTAGQGKRKDRILKELSYDENAKVVNVFDGMKDGTLEVKVVSKDSLSANIYIENKSDAPLTVEIPKAVATKHTLKQFGAGVGGNNAGGGGNQNQSTGGNVGGAGGGGFGGAGGGGGFSIPAGKIAKVPYQSVCLNHGKKEPSSKKRYELVKIETVTNNPAVIVLVGELNNPKVNRMAAQAAIWRMASRMSWAQLSAKMKNRRNSYFTPAQISQGKKLASMATFAAIDKEEADKKTENVKEIPRRKSVRQLNLEALNK